MNNHPSLPLVRLICQTMKLIATAIVLLLSVAAVSAEELLSTEGTISETDSGSAISVWILQPGRYVIDGKKMFASIELPKQSSAETVAASLSPFVASTKKAQLTADYAPVNLTRSDSPQEDIENNLPPNPNAAKTWHVFTLDVPPHHLQSPLKLTFTSPTKGLRFSRILLGRPSTLRSDIIGAFAPRIEKSEKDGVIMVGEDYLGTSQARQRIRIPAGAFGEGSEAFDEVVDFGELPIDKQRLSRADTVMVRTRDIVPGETTPIRIVAFGNRALKPIHIKTKGEGLDLLLTSTLSPHAVSSGFITLKEDGTYESTSCLYPVLTLQPVVDGVPVGTPVVLDTALTQVPGFPFYLGSDGGRWSSEKPERRLETLKTSNFFNANGEASKFNHSNGKGDVIGKCVKDSVFAN